MIISKRRKFKKIFNYKNLSKKRQNYLTKIAKIKSVKYNVISFFNKIKEDSNYSECFEILASNEEICTNILQNEKLREEFLDFFVPRDNYDYKFLPYLMDIFNYDNNTRFKVLTHIEFNKNNNYKYDFVKYNFTKNVLLNFLKDANDEDLQKLADNLDNNLVVRYALIKEYKHLQLEGKNTDNIETIFKFYLESEREDEITKFVFNKLLKNEPLSIEKINLNEENIDSILDLIQSGAINYSDLNTDNLSHELLELIYKKINNKIFDGIVLCPNNCFLNKNISNFVFDFVSDNKIDGKINNINILKQNFIDRLIFLKDISKFPKYAILFDSIIMNQIIEAQENFLKRYDKELIESNKEYSNSLLDEEKYQFFKDVVNVGKVNSNYDDCNINDFNKAKSFISETINNVDTNEHKKKGYNNFAVLDQFTFHKLDKATNIDGISIAKYKNSNNSKGKNSDNSKDKNSEQFEKSQSYSDIFDAQKNNGGCFKSLEEAFSIIKDIDKDSVKQLKEFLMEDHHLFDGFENQTVEFIKKTNGASTGLIIKFENGQRFFVKDEGNDRDVGSSCYLLDNEENSIIPKTYIKKYGDSIMTITKGVGSQDLDEALFKAVSDDKTIEVENHFMKKLKDKNNKEYLNNFSETFCEIFVKSFITNNLDINANNIRVCDDGRLFLIDCLHYDNVEFNSLLDCDIDGNNFAENLFVNVFFRNQMLHGHANRTPLNDGTKKILNTLINSIGKENLDEILINKIGQSIIDVKSRYNKYMKDNSINEKKIEKMEEGEKKKRAKEMRNIYSNSIFKFKRLLSDICVYYPDIAKNIIRTIETKDKELFSEIIRYNKNIQNLLNDIDIEDRKNVKNKKDYVVFGLTQKKQKRHINSLIASCRKELKQIINIQPSTGRISIKSDKITINNTLLNINNIENIKKSTISNICNKKSINKNQKKTDLYISIEKMNEVLNENNDYKKGINNDNFTNFTNEVSKKVINDKQYVRNHDSLSGKVEYESNDNTTTITLKNIKKDNKLKPDLEVKIDFGKDSTITKETFIMMVGEFGLYNLIEQLGLKFEINCKNVTINNLKDFKSNNEFKKIFEIKEHGKKELPEYLKRNFIKQNEKYEDTQMVENFKSVKSCLKDFDSIFTINSHFLK